MKRVIINALSVLILLPALSGKLYAQTTEGAENYYSNPQKGIKATAPKAYVDTTVVSKSNDLTVELSGEQVPPQGVIGEGDSVKGDFKNANYYDYEYSARINRFHRGMGFGYYDDHYTDLYWYTGNPRYWGTSIYYCWDPWYSPYWNGWYHPGWGGSWWTLSFGWGWGPYWSHSWGYSPYWSYGWGWGYDPYWSYGWGGYYGWSGYYGWGGYWGYYNSLHYWRGREFGHSYLGATRAPSRGQNSFSSKNGAANTLNRGQAVRVPSGTVRRGGVDLNRGNQLGTGANNRGNTGRQTTLTSANNTARYGKPESIANSRGRNSYATKQPRVGNPAQSGVNNGRNDVRGNRFGTTAESRTNNSRFNSDSRGNRSFFGSESSSRGNSSRSSSFGSGSSSRGNGSSSRGSSFGSGSSSRGNSGSSSRGNSGSSSRGGRR